jgi:hypothetical protein
LKPSGPDIDRPGQTANNRLKHRILRRNVRPDRQPDRCRDRNRRGVF